MPGKAMVQLTFYQPELIPHRHISVLHFTFRGEEVRRRVRRTYRKEKHKHYSIVSGFRSANLLSAYPKISAQPRRSRPFTEISLTGGDTNSTAYLVPKGQQVVVEKDGGDRIRIILDVIPHSELHERRRLIPTFTATLRFGKSRVRNGYP